MHLKMFGFGIYVWFKISEDTNTHYIDNAWFRHNNFNMMFIKYNILRNVRNFDYVNRFSA